MQTFAHIRGHEAAAVRERLLDALGNTNAPHRWQIFMRLVRSELPEILSAGRPTAAAIAASPIGQLGFTNWRVFVDTPVDFGGLGLGYSTWRQWARAWAVIADLDAYRDTAYQPAEINRISQACRKINRDFPAEPEHLEAFKAEQAQERKRKRPETAVSQRKQIQQLQETVKRQQAVIERLKQAVEDRNKTIIQQRETISQLQGKRFLGHLADAFKLK